jgi:hypothetical protein
MTAEYYNYKDYEEYVKMQKSKAARTTRVTVRYAGRRRWIYQQMVENHVEGNSILCLGARHAVELEFFREKGYKVVDGIDLFKNYNVDDSIIECDMSKMHEHPYFKDKKYDVVFSHASMEHCLDFDGFIKGLDQICTKFFVCFCPQVKVTTLWDCSQHKFMEHAQDDALLKIDLQTSFLNFNIVFSNYYPSNNVIFFILEKKI